MQVKCVLCDKVEELEDNSFQAKRLRNRRVSVYMCNDCYQRISNKTNERHLTKKFHLFKSNNQEDEYI